VDGERSDANFGDRDPLGRCVARGNADCCIDAHITSRAVNHGHMTRTWNLLRLLWLIMMMVIVGLPMRAVDPLKDCVGPAARAAG